MQLHEKYRPKTLADMAGQVEAVALIRRIVGRPGWDGDAFWITGPSGSGKTTLANVLATTYADPFDIQDLTGAKCDIDAVRELEQTLNLASFGPKGWRAVIVNEAQAMTPRAVQGWLPLLEPLPRRRLVLFTSTQSLDGSLFGDFTEPFSSRVKVVRLVQDVDGFAARAKKIAAHEGLDGQPLEAYRRLVRQCHFNMRAVLQRIESGEMTNTARKKVAALPAGVSDHAHSHDAERRAFATYRHLPNPKNRAAWLAAKNRRRP